MLPSGIDTSFFSPSPLPDGPPEALFVGRFVDKKGLDTLASAWPAVRRAVPHARLRILGYGPLEALARSISGPVTVVQTPDRETVRDAMRLARLVVSPSHTATDDAVESLLMVNVEAQASGRPVVTTRHGGIPEYVREDETALLVPESDPAALARALVRGALGRRLGGTPGRGRASLGRRPRRALHGEPCGRPLRRARGSCRLAARNGRAHGGLGVVMRPLDDDRRDARRQAAGGHVSDDD